MLRKRITNHVSRPTPAPPAHPHQTRVGSPAGTTSESTGRQGDWIALPPPVPPSRLASPLWRRSWSPRSTLDPSRRRLATNPAACRDLLHCSDSCPLDSHASLDLAAPHVITMARAPSPHASRPGCTTDRPPCCCGEHTTAMHAPGTGAHRRLLPGGDVAASRTRHPSRLQPYTALPCLATALLLAASTVSAVRVGPECPEAWMDPECCFGEYQSQCAGALLATTTCTWLTRYLP